MVVLGNGEGGSGRILYAGVPRRYDFADVLDEVHGHGLGVAQQEGPVEEPRGRVLLRPLPSRGLLEQRRPHLHLAAPQSRAHGLQRPE